MEPTLLIPDGVSTNMATNGVIPDGMQDQKWAHYLATISMPTLKYIRHPGSFNSCDKFVHEMSTPGTRRYFQCLTNTWMWVFVLTWEICMQDGCSKVSPMHAVRALHQVFKSNFDFKNTPSYHTEVPKDFLRFIMKGHNTTMPHKRITKNAAKLLFDVMHFFVRSSSVGLDIVACRIVMSLHKRVKTEPDHTKKKRIEKLLKQGYILTPKNVDSYFRMVLSSTIWLNVSKD
jgi:hypothetical protein